MRELQAVSRPALTGPSVGADPRDRRSPALRLASNDAMTVGGILSINPRLRAVKVHGQAKSLTRGQYELLMTFVRRIDEVVPFGDLHEAACGVRWNGDTRSVRQLVSKLVRSIGPAATLIRNIRGVGYAMVSKSFDDGVSQDDGA